MNWTVVTGLLWSRCDPVIDIPPLAEFGRVSQVFFVFYFLVFLGSEVVAYNSVHNPSVAVTRVVLLHRTLRDEIVPGLEKSLDSSLPPAATQSVDRIVRRTTMTFKQTAAVTPLAPSSNWNALKKVSSSEA